MASLGTDTALGRGCGGRRPDDQRAGPETVASKPSYREAFRRRRCLVPADGYYEWRQHGRPKQPFYIRLREDRPFALAGIWERWQRGETTVESCAIITTAANALLRPLHDRMPVILASEHFEQWLDPAIDDPLVLEPLLVDDPRRQMLAYPVSTLVNSPRFDTPRCIEAAELEKTQGTLFD